MQGVVGMLDVMHATVREAIETKTPVKSGGVFQALKEGIEMVQGWFKATSTVNKEY